MGYGANCQRWEEEEDSLLAYWQSQFGNRWSLVAKKIPGRTGQQCAQRWRHTNPYICKGKWTAAEDAHLVQLVETCGAGKWAEIARHMAGRTDQQCLARWTRHLDPSINKGGWSKEEDELLLALYDTYGSNWSRIAKQLKVRIPHQCRSRWNVLSKARKRARAGSVASGSSGGAAVAGKRSKPNMGSKDDPDFEVSQRERAKHRYSAAPAAAESADQELEQTEDEEMDEGDYYYEAEQQQQLLRGQGSYRFPNKLQRAQHYGQHYEQQYEHHHAHDFGNKHQSFEQQHYQQEDEQEYDQHAANHLCSSQQRSTTDRLWAAIDLAQQELDAATTAAAAGMHQHAAAAPVAAASPHDRSPQRRAPASCSEDGSTSSSPGHGDADGGHSDEHGGAAAARRDQHGRSSNLADMMRHVASLGAKLSSMVPGATAEAAAPGRGSASACKALTKVASAMTGVQAGRHMLDMQELPAILSGVPAAASRSGTPAASDFAGARELSVAAAAAPGLLMRTMGLPASTTAATAAPAAGGAAVGGTSSAAISAAAAVNRASSASQAAAACMAAAVVAAANRPLAMPLRDREAVAAEAAAQGGAAAQHALVQTAASFKSAGPEVGAPGHLTAVPAAATAVAATMQLGNLVTQLQTLRSLEWWATQSAHTQHLAQQQPAAGAAAAGVPTQPPPVPQPVHQRQHTSMPASCAALLYAAALAMQQQQQSTVPGSTVSQGSGLPQQQQQHSQQAVPQPAAEPMSRLSQDPGKVNLLGLINLVGRILA